MCILLVTAWFIYQLKHESRWARCIFRNTKWIRTLTGWIGVLMDAVLRWIKRILAWTWSYMSRPYRNCRPSLLHLLRKYILVCSPISVTPILNLTLCTRAFGNDKYVARLNLKVMRFDSARDWSEPYSICKSIRRRVRAIIKH